MCLAAYPERISSDRKWFDLKHFASTGDAKSGAKAFGVTDPGRVSASEQGVPAGTPLGSQNDAGPLRGEVQAFGVGPYAGQVMTEGQCAEWDDQSEPLSQQ